MPLDYRRFMKNVKLTLAFDGGNYNGSQKQDNTNLTIEENLEKALKVVLNEKPELVFSSRTDKGVHAYGMVVNFKTRSKKALGDIQKEVNKELPNDIVIRQIEKVDDDFHARYKSKAKVYQYKIYNDDKIDPFKRKYYYFKREKLDIDKMREAAELIVGTHDFIGFSSVKKSKKSTVKTINKIDIVKEDKDIFIFVEGDNFLYNMVRIIVGTLIEIGVGNMDKENITKVFEDKVRNEAGKTIAPNGLYLQKVVY